MQIKVTYEGSLNPALDQKIIDAIESAGGKWYAEGMDLTTNVRDICFKLVAERKIREEEDEG